MILGNGDIAKKLVAIDRTDVLFFASGVSNRQKITAESVKREGDLLLAQSSTQRCVYFSSLAIYHTLSPYAVHKWCMEHLVRTHFRYSLIVRLGNISWGDNPNTLLNVLRAQIRSGLDPRIDLVPRFVVTPERFLSEVQEAVRSYATEVNIHGQRYSVAEIATRIREGEL